MAVTVRLARLGNRNNPFFRIVAIDTRRPTDGRYIEALGWYNPSQGGTNFKLKLERLEYWVANGAKLSDTVRSLLKKARNAPTIVAPPPEPAVTEVAPETDANGTGPEPDAQGVAELEATADEDVTPDRDA